MSDKEILLFTILWIIAFLLFVLIFLILRIRYKNDSNSWKILQNELFNLNKTFDEKLFFLNKMIGDNFSQNLKLTTQISDKSNKTIKELTEKLSEIQQTNNQIKDIWVQLKWLENILQNPKQRWILWEYMLENILKNILPTENYQLQYKFKNNDIVDAVIFLQDKIIPIDSKFSLENYNKLLETQDEKYEKEFKKDLKNRIDETSKYIKPEEKTMDFAFMFIPSEALYYDLLVNKIWTNKDFNLIEYAFREKKVIIVWPTSFYAYLQTVLQWLKALKIENKISEIKKYISLLSKHLSNYNIYFEKLWNSINTTQNHYEKAQKEFEKIDKDIIKIWETEN